MIRELTDTEKNIYNDLVRHPLQSWEWGEFRRKTGIEVVRFGTFAGETLISAFQMTLHKLPLLPYVIGYIPKGPLLDNETLKFLQEFGKKKQCVFIKFEPNVIKDVKFKIQDLRLTPSTRPLFTKYTFYVDLRKSEEELLQNMSNKTRYNIKLAQKHGVTVQEDNTAEAFNRYLELTKETTKRQGFYAHNESYHRLMWKHLHPQPTTHLPKADQPRAGNPQPIAHLLTARYHGKTLVAWIVFLFNNILYYPYGASSNEHKNVMASTLMMWETMRFGKRMEAQTFDLWGTPGPDPQPTDSYYGFHRFKLGFGPELIEFVGSFDLVIYPLIYSIFNLTNQIRWGVLRLIKH